MIKLTLKIFTVVDLLPFYNQYLVHGDDLFFLLEKVSPFPTLNFLERNT